MSDTQKMMRVVRHITEEELTETWNTTVADHETKILDAPTPEAREEARAVLDADFKARLATRFAPYTVNADVRRDFHGMGIGEVAMSGWLLEEAT